MRGRTTPIPRTLPGLLAHTRIDGDCWRWGTGTGRRPLIRVEGRAVLVYRLVFEMCNGRIPAGLQIDHIWARGCRWPDCIRPDHLEAVDSRTNTGRGFHPNAVAHRDGTCTQGHPMTEGHPNLYVSPDGQRKCLTCHRDRGRHYYAQAKER